ncbi:hypothetical protein PG985_013455 [Apiospora marii]|uniref:uncharacterized protein n=1 Tax=Apiospora marii TaxID=335849 RepID=UPI00312F4570
MNSKRAFLLLLAAAASALATVALPERSRDFDHVPVSNIATSKLMAPATVTRRPYPVVPEDCQTVVNRVESHEGSLNVLPGTCLVWLEGTCGARFCAAEEVTFKGLNQTFQWVGEQLDHLFRYCIVNGQDGLKGDCEDLNGSCGFYRLHLEHRGNDWPNSTGSGI